MIWLVDSQVYNNMNYGNATAASIPIALTEAWEKNRVKPGNKIVAALGVVLLGEAL